MMPEGGKATQYWRGEDRRQMMTNDVLKQDDTMYGGWMEQGDSVCLIATKSVPDG